MQISIQKVKGCLCKIDKRAIFVAMVITVVVSYYINPLDNIELTDWNRTFCSALLSGISIDARIGNFYKLFFFYLPIIFILTLGGMSYLFKRRITYKEFFIKYSILTFFSAIASHISRFTPDSEVNENPMLQCIIAFLVIFVIISLIDYKEQISVTDFTILFVEYVVAVISCNLIFHSEKIITYIIITGLCLVGIMTFLIRTTTGNKLHQAIFNWLLVLMWLPAFIRGALEGLYFLTEHGRNVERYFTHLSSACLIFIVLSVLVTWFITRRSWNIKIVGYIGALTSCVSIGYFSYSYQYVFNYGSFANVYELGNDAVAMDTFLYGKIPIVDYFSAHALGDVWTKLIYCFIHNDINGILVDPYSGLNNVLALIILFYIFKELFDENISVLLVMLFPGMIISIKWASICMISIAMLIHIMKKQTVKSYVLFWTTVLISAFTSYDEGISLGVACILAYILCCLFQKLWIELKKFIISGAAIGFGVLLLYVIYALITGVPVIGRIKEWMSVSVGSSSSWATSNFGDPTSFAFLISYFVVPITAVVLLVLAIARYIVTKKNIKLMALTAAFTLTEILYITRTIVYHNLAVCSGWTGVLLNFIHWTVSIYVLYRLTDKDASENRRIMAFASTLLLVILAESTAVTNYWPTADSSLLNKSLVASNSWDIQDGFKSNIGQPRIVYDDDTTAMVNQFKNIFDLLLTDEQTFLDFANVTSLYLMTDRERPCYVGQSPSLLTDLYSQECFLNEISEYDCPLVVLGTTKTSYLQQMVGIPHNVRYYKIAEYIYKNYRPLVKFDEFAIWCERVSYDQYRDIFQSAGLNENEYSIVDYGYDFTASYVDENGNTQFSFAPYHSYNLGSVPYIWANYDDYNALENNVLINIDAIGQNCYYFEGSQSVLTNSGNYLAFEMMNVSEDDISINIVFYDSNNEGAKIHYYFTVKPGMNSYLIRVSEDYFWDIYNIDTILFGSNEAVSINNVKILEGD